MRRQACVCAFGEGGPLLLISHSARPYSYLIFEGIRWECVDLYAYVLLVEALHTVCGIGGSLQCQSAHRKTFY